MKFGVIGLGKWGQTFVKTLKSLEGEQLVAVSSSEMSYDKMPAELKFAKYYADPVKMMESDLDTVIVATHPNAHFSYSALALWHDKNVICEKPCLFTHEQFNKIEELRENKLFYTDYTNLHHNVMDEMVNVIYNATTKPRLNLVNIGNGPFREGYSDLWDYGSHIMSVVHTLFPNVYFSDIQYELDSIGNHQVEMFSRDVEVKALFGNKAPARVHTFELSGGNMTSYWSNDKSENPLATMLTRCSKGRLQTNISLSQKIHGTLSQIERE